MPRGEYEMFPPEQRFIIQVWKWQTKGLEEYARCGTMEEAEKILEQSRSLHSTGRIIEVHKFYTDQR